MDKKEKVIRGLECCRQNTPDDPFQQCGACPYNINGIYVEDCRSVLSGDALEVLRPSGGGWISVKDRLPEINEPVLFTGKNDIGNRYPAQKGYYSGDEWYTFGGLWDTPLDRVTHWMPLPEPPPEV